MLADSSSRLSAALLTLALLCAGWALWPVVFPAVRVPTVTHTELPLNTAPRSAAAVSPGSAAPEYPTTASVTPLISGRLNLNTATREQLETLPNIGPALAERIVAARPYRDLAQLDAVKGIGERLMQTLTPLVSF